MNKILKYRKLFFLSILLIWLTIPMIAQMKRTGLIFSEVYLNKLEPDKSWLEIYNPTSSTLTLEKLRYYDILTDNILPKEIQEEGGIDILPGECVVLCANKLKFNFTNNKNFKLFQVDGIKSFGRGGFFSLRTKKHGENGEDIFRYGKPGNTAHLENILGDFVIPYSEGMETYTRIKSKSPQEQFKPYFIKVEPSPGSFLESGGSNE